ncbi:MAG: hypothetical protein ABIY48_06160 [Acidimicrobiales bacterium]
MATMTLTARKAPSTVDLRGVLATIAGVLAAAGGLIHLVVIRNHLDVLVVAAGFAVMGTAQGAFALRVLTRPSRQVLLAGGALHTVIAVVWLTSRTTGLVFIPGAEGIEPVGVADLVATTFSLGVLGVSVIARSLDTTSTGVVLPARVARRMTAVVVAGTLCLSVPALLTPHDHDRASHTPDPHSATTELLNSHDGTPHDEHVHPTP